MGNPVMHWELLSKDPAKLSDFYEKVFDWKIQPHSPVI
jgi:predicted enzyme related to lactoylglutathione lyase